MLTDVHKFAAVTRCITITLAIVSYFFIGSYDSSAEIQLETASRHPLLVFLRWDALYFLHIAESGYVFEQETAFFPLMPVAGKLLAKTVLLPLQSFLSYRHTLLLAGAIIANVSFVLAAGALYRLTMTLTNNKKLSFASAIAFCLSPPAMFMSSFYTESLFAWLSFEGMRYVAVRRYYVAALIWGLASAARSNAIVYCGFFFYDLVWMRILNRKNYIAGFLKATLCTLLTTLGFAAFQYYNYNRFCVLDRPWCDQKLPLLYSFVQTEYWGNGFLAYYEVKQIPNFILAAPIILISVMGLKSYIQHDSIRFLTVQLFGSHQQDASTVQKKEEALQQKDFFSPELSVYMYLWTFLLLFVCANMHIQVIIRFFTSLPPMYWYVGHLWTRSSVYGIATSTSNTEKSATLVAKVILSYFVLYGMVGIVLFSGFLPPA